MVLGKASRRARGWNRRRGERREGEGSGREGRWGDKAQGQPASRGPAPLPPSPPPPPTHTPRKSFSISFWRPPARALACSSPRAGGPQVLRGAVMLPMGQNKPGANLPLRSEAGSRTWPDCRLQRGPSLSWRREEPGRDVPPQTVWKSILQGPRSCSVTGSSWQFSPLKRKRPCRCYSNERQELQTPVSPELTLRWSDGRALVSTSCRDKSAARAA